MKILFLTPTRHETDAAIKAIDEVFTVSEHLGLAYLAAVLVKNGFEVEVLDALAEGLDLKGLEIYLNRKHYDVICITTNTPDWKTVIKNLEIVRKIYPKSYIIVGGPHINAMTKINRVSELFEQSGNFDIAVYGEGEVTLLEIVQNIEKNRAVYDLPGTICRLPDGTIKQNASRDLIKNIDTIPFPALDLFPLSKYSRTPSSYKRIPVRSVITTRGCPYSCIFCDRGAFGHSVRKRSIENIMEEVDQLVKKYGTKEIRFWDDVFTMDENRVLNLCLKLEKYDLTWSCNGRVNMITERMLKAMKKAGCWEVDFGIESGNDSILKSIHKQFTVRQANEAISLVKKYGMEVRAFFILGFPGETQSTVEDTINFSLNPKIDYATFYLPQAYPGTELFEIAVKENALESDFSKYLITGSVPSYINKEIGLEKIQIMQKTAYRKFYKRPGYILRRIAAIRNWEDIKRYRKALPIFNMQ